MRTDDKDILEGTNPAEAAAALDRMLGTDAQGLSDEDRNTIRSAAAMLASMAGQANTQPKRQWAIVCQDPDGCFIQCVAIKTGWDAALSCAFEYASDLVTDTESGKNGTISALYGLECDTGYGIHVEYGDSLQCKSNIMLLSCDQPGD